MTNLFKAAEKQIKAAEKRSINPLWGIVIVFGVPIAVLLVGVLSLEATFQWGATTVDKEGNIKYANNISLRGWEAVPFQAIAGLLTSGTAAYGAYKLSTKKESLPPPPEQG